MARHEDDEELKEARGTMRADRNQKIEFTPLEERRYAPDELIGDRAKAEYRRVVKRLIEDGSAADVDESLLIAYCNQVSRYFTLEERIIDKENRAIDVSKLEYGQYNQALKNAQTLGLMFGLTVAGRSKIKPQKAKKKQDADSTESRFSDLMKAG